MTMSWKRRFSSASAHEFLSPAPPRIRTWSDSVAEVATPEEMADRDSELAEAHRRRNSNASNVGSAENQRHVTGFLASQTLALFLAVPTHQPTVRYDDLSRPVALPEDDVHENLESGHQLSRSSSLRRSSYQNSLNSSTESYKPWRRFSERFSGATLNVGMASATKLRRNTVVAVSTGKLDQVASSVENRPAQAEDSMTTEPPSSQLSGNNNNKSLLIIPETPARNNLKKFSQSTPALPQLHYDLHNLGRSKSRQKKFLRYFPDVPRDERVLNHYSCALVGDILFQGHLYVTYNYIAFHSNVFGYVKKLLIPMAGVKKITKEKTARFFPNAIAITTESEKHLFSSLMSRDVAYRLAFSVWRKFHFPNGGEDFIDGERENEGSSQNGEHSSNESSQNSVEGIILSHPPAATSSIQITSASDTSSDLDENDSTTERLHSDTPEREEGNDNNRLSLLAKSRNNLLNLFSSRKSLVKQDDEDEASTSNDVLTKDDDEPFIEKQVYAERNWDVKGICFLLVISCLLAGMLWYKTFLLHSNLEMRLLSSEENGETDRPHMTSLYSPQMQELVDNLHVLLTTRAANEERKSLP